MKTKMINLFITSNCTLKCELCGSSLFEFSKVWNEDIDVLRDALCGIFRVYDYVEHIDLTGGEPMLYPDLIELLIEIEKYKEQFGFLRILTNGTILPSSKLIMTILDRSYKVDFFIDNYGVISGKIQELKTLLDSVKLSYREINYSGEQQYCDGWIDFGNFEKREYSTEEIVRVFDKCHLAHHMCLTEMNGYLYQCVRAAIGEQLGKFKIDDGGKFNLRDNNDFENRKIASEFGCKPNRACEYCNGFDAKEGKRYPAAVQKR